MAQHKTTFGGVDVLRFLAAVISHPRCRRRALTRGGVPYLAAIPVVGTAMIAASWLIATEAEPRIRLLFDHTLFRYRLKAA